MSRANNFTEILCVVVISCILFCGCQSPAPTQAKTAKESVAEKETAKSPAVKKEAFPHEQQTLPVKPAEKPAVNQKIAHIEIENAVHDFGVLVPDSLNKCQYKFKNTGEGLLKIDQVISTCGCTVPELAKKEYTTGETGVIDVSFHAPAYAGEITKHLYIVSNDPAAPRAELALKAKVEVKVVTDPNKPIGLILNKENAGMIPIKVKCIDGVPFAITSFTVTGQCMTAEFDPKKKATEHILTPRVDISKLQELNTGVIQIGVDHPDAKEVMVSYNAVPMYELRPPRIVLQNVETGVANKREVWIINNYGQEFEIESITSRAGYMSVVNQKKDGMNIGLDVEITIPKKETPARYITDDLNVKIKNGPTLVVRCSGWFKL